MKGLHGLLFLSVIYDLPLLCNSQTFNQSLELLGDVFRNYDRRLRPTLNQSLPVNVNVTFTLLNIEEFDEVAGEFAVTGVLVLIWNDEKITWNATDYGGIGSLMFPLTDVWYPALILIYPHGKYDDFADDWMTVRISNNGFAVFAPGAVFKTTCSVDVTYYPFDIQTCSLVFLPWGYYPEEVTLNTPDEFIDRTYYIEHGEWEIIGNESVSSDPIENTVRFTFKLKRKPWFFVINTILPIILMSLLNVLIFALPPESGERISYGITVLLAIAVFLTIIGDNLPKTSNPMSVLSYFLMVNLTLGALMCMFAILNLRVYFRKDEDAFPIWALVIIKITKGTCRKPRSKVTHIDSKKLNVGKELFDDDKKVNECQTAAPDMPNESGTKTVTWCDVSKAIDVMCTVFFLLVILINTVTFVMIVAYGPE